MNKIVLISNLLCCLTLLCCNTKTEKEVKTIVQSNQEFSFDKEILGVSRLQNFGGKEYYCVGNFATQKVILAYDKDNKTKLRFDISSACLNNRISDFKIISKDTIVLLPLYDTRLFVMNSEGEMWKIIDFSASLKEYFPWKVELMSNQNGFMLDDKKACFRVVLDYSDSTIVKREFDADSVANTLADIIIIDDIFDPKEIKFSENYYSRICGKNQYCLEYHCANIHPEVITFRSYFSDTIYFLNPNLELIKAVKLSSKYGGIFIKPPPFNSEVDMNNLLLNNGKIFSVLYDAVDKQYYCSVGQKAGEHYIPSTIVLNKNFEQINEFETAITPENFRVNLLYDSNYNLIASRTEKDPNKLGNGVFEKVTFFPIKVK